MKAKSKPPSSSYRTDHMANERTFLAWIRTGIGIMAFGFVVEKFALFIKKLSSFLGAESVVDNTAITNINQKYTSLFGIFLVVIGALIGVSAFIKYRAIYKQIEENRYQYSSSLAITLTVIVVIMGIFLSLYLIKS